MLAAGGLLARVVSQAEPAGQLAYRLYTLCERAGLAEEARAYNELITSWTGIETAAVKEPSATQRMLFEGGGMKGVVEQNFIEKETQRCQKP